MFEKTLGDIRQLESVPLNRLRELVDYDSDLHGKIEISDRNLMKFLYSRNLNATDAYDLIKKYVKYKTNNLLLFQNLGIHDQSIKAALESSLPELLPHKDRKCRTIIVFHANNWDGNISLTSIFKALLLCLEYALQDIHVQNNGFVIIVNWEQFTLRKTSWISLPFISSMIDGLQSFPAKFFELHFIASSWYINAIFNIMKLSFSEELRENFFIHGRNLSTLYDYIHRDILPTELGGSKPSYNAAKLIEELEKYCDLENNL